MQPGGRGPALYQRSARHARQKIKATNAAAVEAAGAGRSPMSRIRSTKIHELAKKYPDKTYKELEAASFKPQA